MSHSATCGVVSISIDVEASSDRAPPPIAVDSLLVEIIDRFHQHRLAGTWVFSEPASSKLAVQHARHSPGHEIALLGDAVLAGHDVPRATLVRTVVRRLQSAADAGLSISTLCIPAAWTPSHADLLVKHGITMVRSPSLMSGSLPANSRKHLAGPNTSDSVAAGVQAVGYGIWHLPIAARMCGGRWLANFSQVRRVSREVELAARCGAACHVQIDVVSMAQSNVAGNLRIVDRLLQHLVRLRDAGRIAIETPRATAQRLQPRRLGAGARSILRAA